MINGATLKMAASDNKYMVFVEGYCVDGDILQRVLTDRCWIGQAFPNQTHNRALSRVAQCIVVKNQVPVTIKQGGSYRTNLIVKVDCRLGGNLNDVLSINIHVSG